MKQSGVNLALIVLACSLISGCFKPNPDIQELKSMFAEQKPEYIIKRIKIIKSDGDRRTVSVDFDAPNNLKPVGHSDLICQKQTDGSFQNLRK
jgi:hypothetical protein